MTAALIVTIEVEDADLTTVAEQMQEVLLDAGYPIVSVAPWARESMTVDDIPQPPLPSHPATFTSMLDAMPRIVPPTAG